MTMQSRLDGLQRLVAIYSMVEDLHSMELQRATSAVQSAQQQILEQGVFEDSIRRYGRGALQEGDRLRWRMAETQQQASIKRADLLAQERRERVAFREAVMQQYVASRLRREQMKRLQDDVAEVIEAEGRRREQVVSDDRYLARRRWIESSDRRLRRPSQE